jgi:hypothetical protein
MGISDDQLQEVERQLRTQLEQLGEGHLPPGFPWGVTPPEDEPPSDEPDPRYPED